MFDTTPDAVDWTNSTTAVKDQGECGGCWAYSTVETIESSVFLGSGKFVDLSTEQLLDCDFDATGCSGGDPSSGVNYLMGTGGNYVPLSTAANYPDTTSATGFSHPCTWNKKGVVKVTGGQFAVPECTSGTCASDEDALATAVASYGPLVVCMNSGIGTDADWKHYKNGVWDKDSCVATFDSVDHCVQLVGYDKKAQVPYWKVRNSWGPNFGEDGYIRFAMGKNMCCIGCEALIISAELTPEEEPATPSFANVLN